MKEKEIICPYCDNYKEYVFEDGSIGNVRGHGVDKLGFFCVEGKKCGNCEGDFSIFNQNGEIFIKYNIKHEWSKNNKGINEVSYDRMEIRD